MSNPTNIRSRRVALGWSQTDLSDRANCGQSSVSRLELGGGAARAIQAAIEQALSAEERRRARLR